LRLAGVAREAMVDDGLRFVRRDHDDGVTYFLANWGDGAIDGWISLATPAAAAALYDPLHGRAGMAQVRTTPAGGSEVRLQLQPGDTRVVRTYHRPTAGPAW